MPSSKTKLNLALLLGVVLLVLIVAYKPGKDSIDQYKISPVDKSSINHIRLERIGAEPIEFTKKDNNWFMLSPYALDTNQINVESLLDVFDYTYHAKYDSTIIELKKYRLDAPRASIIFNTKYRFEFGKTEPLNKYRYILFNKNMYLTDDYFHHRILASATSFLNHALLEKDQIIEKIKLPGLSLTLNDGTWTVKPTPKNFSNDQANELSDNWKNVHASSIVKYDQFKSSGQISLSFKNNPTPLKLDIVTLNNSFYLARSDINIMYQLANEKRRDLLQLPPLISTELPEKKSTSTNEAGSKKLNTQQPVKTH